MLSRLSDPYERHADDRTDDGGTGPAACDGIVGDGGSSLHEDWVGAHCYPKALLRKLGHESPGMVMNATMTDANPRATAGQSRFFLWTAVAMAATAFLGFAPTFWIPLAQGVPERIPVLAIHGGLFFSWTLLLIYQCWLVSTGRIVRHRDIGLLGISLATGMTIFGTMAAINSARRAAATNYAVAGETFMIVPMAAMLLFTVFVIAAIYNVRRPDWHKRLMLAATAVILDAAIARPFIAYIVMGGHLPPFQGTVGIAGLGGPPPPVAGLLLPSLACLLFIVAGMIYDWRALGRVHPAYWWAGGFALAVSLLKIPISDTVMWHGAARFLIALAG